MKLPKEVQEILNRKDLDYKEKLKLWRENLEERSLRKYIQRRARTSGVPYDVVKKLLKLGCPHCGEKDMKLLRIIKDVRILEDDSILIKPSVSCIRTSCLTQSSLR